MFLKFLWPPPRWTTIFLLQPGTQSPPALHIRETKIVQNKTYSYNMLGTWIFSILIYFIYFLNADLWHSLMNINSQFKVKNALSMPIITLQWVTGDKSNTQKASCPCLDLPFPIAVWLSASYLTFLTSSQKWNDTCMILHNLFERTGEMLPMKVLA